MNEVTIIEANEIHSKGHPKELFYLAASYGLYIFAYIGVNVLIVLYGIDQLHLKTSAAYLLYAAYNALIFTLPLAGGYVSDKFGYKNSTILGIIISLIGFFLICFHYATLFYLGIALFIVGYGVTTPSFLCLVGLMYAKEDKRRDSGYTIFYLLFNLGSITATVSLGSVVEIFNYSTAFALTDLALFISLVIVFFTNKKLTIYSKKRAVQQSKLSKSKSLSILILMLLILAVIIMPLLIYPILNEVLLWILVVGVCIWIIAYSNKLSNQFSKTKLRAFLILTVISGFFWSLYMLEASLMTIFAEFNVNRNIFGITIHPATFFGLDPFGVVVFGLILSWLWHYLSDRGRNPSLPTKFTLALISMGLGYIVFAIGTGAANFNLNHLVNPFWIVFGYAFLTLGEMLLSPIGFAMVGRLSPEGKDGVLMGVWTLFIGFGAVLSGYLANFTNIKDNVTSSIITNPIYMKYFFYLGVFSILLGLMLSLFIPKIKNLLHLHHSISSSIPPKH